MDAEIYRARRERVLSRLGGGVLVIPSAREARRNGDAEYAYRQESDLLYLTGFSEPGSLLVLHANRTKRFTLFVRPRNKDEETWTGRRHGVEGAAATFGADEAFSIDDLEKELPKLLSNAHTLHYPLGLDPEFDRTLVAMLSKLRATTRTGIPIPDRIADVGPLLHELRLHKDDSEIARLRTAADLTNRAHRRAMAATKPGLREYEIEAEMIYEYRKGGGTGPGYEPIVAAGVNSTILHYRTGRDELKDGELLLIDSGCEYEGYTADVTRTWPVNGRWSRPQQALYEIVLEAHFAALDAVKPGVPRDFVHETAGRSLIRGLVREGLLKGEEDRLWADKTKESYRRYFMHGTSHWLGLDVHDAGALFAGGTSRPLAPGMVLTVEPGLYIAPDDDRAPPEYRGIGIRIEDDVLVTRAGRDVLTEQIPRTIDELRRAQAG